MEKTQIVLFGGTTEGRELACQLAGEGFAVTVSVATPLGVEELGENPAFVVRCGRLGQREMAALLHGTPLCIDATHPYAVEASRNIRAAAEACGAEYLRLARPQSTLPAGCRTFADAGESAAALKNTEGNILLTTGAKELGAFAELPPERLFPRVLPTHEGIAACEAQNIPHRNIIAMQGPFSQAMNEALIEQFQIRWLLTKDGGAAGGFDAKAQAAAAKDVRLIVLRRPPEKERRTMAEILQRCEEIGKCR